MHVLSNGKSACMSVNRCRLYTCKVVTQARVLAHLLRGIKVVGLTSACPCRERAPS